MKLLKQIPGLFFASLMLLSCEKYQDIRDANYAEQRVYMPASVEGNSVNGIYHINTVAVLGQVYRYVADVSAGKLIIPLAVYRSGVNVEGAINVSIVANIDTVNKLILANKFPAVSELLPAEKYTISPEALIIGNGEGYKELAVDTDLKFLLDNPTKKFAFAVTASSNQKTGTGSTTVVYIDPAFLVPVSKFTTTINATTRTVNFSNTSVNANAFSWDYGDGTPSSTEKAVPHTYATSGTYTIKLTASGALGDFNKSVFSAVVIIP